MYVEASTDAVITNDMKSRTHECTVMGPSSNWQGSTKCFDSFTIKVVTRCTVKEVPMPDRIRELAEKRGTKSRGRYYKKRVEFLIHTKEKFEWEDDDVPTGETTGEEEPIYPSLIAEIPRVELETNFEDMEDTVQETSAPLLADQAAAAA